MKYRRPIKKKKNNNNNNNNKIIIKIKISLLII